MGTAIKSPEQSRLISCFEIGHNENLKAHSSCMMITLVFDASNPSSFIKSLNRQIHYVGFMILIEFRLRFYISHHRHVGFMNSILKLIFLINRTKIIMSDLSPVWNRIFYINPSKFTCRIYEPTLDALAYKSVTKKMPDLFFGIRIRMFNYIRQYVHVGFMNKKYRFHCKNINPLYAEQWDHIEHIFLIFFPNSLSKNNY